MHSHKVKFFETSGEMLRDFFSGFLEAKLSDLKRIVSGAERNIQKYQESVNISNSNLTKSWLDQYTAIQDYRNKAGDRIRTVKKLPHLMSNADEIATALSDMRSDLTRHAGYMSDRLTQSAQQTGLEQLKKEFARVERALTDVELDTLAPKDHGLQLVPLEWNFNDVDIVPVHYLTKKCDDVRENSRRFITSAVSEVKRGFEEIQRAINQRAVIDKCEMIVDAAQASLERDLEQYFQSVEVYRAGVFALQTKASIASLGVGKELDQLETEFTEEDKEAIKLRGKNQLFPDFAEIQASGTTDLTALSDTVRDNVEALSKIRVDPPPSVQVDVEAQSVSQIPAFISELKNGLQQEANDFIERMQTRISGVIGTVLHAYKSELSAAQASRMRSYAVATLTLGLIFLLGYLAYIKWLGKPVGQTRWEAVFWGVLINAIGYAAGFGYAVLRDHYPRTKSSIKDRQLASLKEQVHLAIEDALSKFTVVQTAVLTTKLEALYASVTSPQSDVWQASTEQSYSVVRSVTDEFDLARRKYLDVIDKLAKQCGSYFEDHNHNLELLKATAQGIKEKAIEPSFKLLENTESNLRAVREEIAAIRFH